MQPLKTKTKYERENYEVTTVAFEMSSVTNGAACTSLAVKLRTYPLKSPAAVPV